MFKTLEITEMANALASHAGARLGTISRNMANADTPGYRSRDVAGFAEVWNSDSKDALRATRAGHIGAGPAQRAPEVILASSAQSPNGNSVSLETEMVKTAEVRQQHDMALAIYRTTSDIIRASLGRR